MLLHYISQTLPNSDCNLPQTQILLNPASNESPKIALNQAGLLKTNLKDQSSGLEPLSPSAPNLGPPSTLCPYLQYLRGLFFTTFFRSISGVTITR